MGVAFTDISDSFRLGIGESGCGYWRIVMCVE